eukprot:GEMP01092805.1.p1 GENE.GEMP01092805.1~~GEMP01092805.1.p1  ORF type:complete len:210 (+),score=18.36 GEMP01092805.1:24-632(+)
MQNLEGGPSPRMDNSEASNAPQPAGPPQPSASERWVGIQRALNHRLDKLHPWSRARWSVFGTLILFFLYRVVSLHGFYIIAYAYGIYILNLTIGFLSPATDPELDFEIPAEESREFRPFVRRLPEFKFWWAGTKWLILAVFLTFIPACDLPVFWPILVGYFCVLAFVTMKDRVKHMIKYKYVPWTTGKKRHRDPILPSSSKR